MKIDIALIAGIVVTVLVALLFVCIIAGGIQNEMNAITNGIIVDRDYTAGYTSYSSNKSSGHMYSYPPTYRFTIEGEKGGKTVQYTFEVTEEEYHRYKIGDWYER